MYLLSPKVTSVWSNLNHLQLSKKYPSYINAKKNTQFQINKCVSLVSCPLHSSDGVGSYSHLPALALPSNTATYSDRKFACVAGTLWNKLPHGYHLTSSQRRPLVASKAFIKQAYSVKVMRENVCSSRVPHGRFEQLYGKAPHKNWTLLLVNVYSRVFRDKQSSSSAVSVYL